MEMTSEMGRDQTPESGPSGANIGSKPIWRQVKKKTNRIDPNKSVSGGRFLFLEYPDLCRSNESVGDIRVDASTFDVVHKW
jgi:hypothetical protein